MLVLTQIKNKEITKLKLQLHAYNMSLLAFTFVHIMLLVIRLTSLVSTAYNNFFGIRWPRDVFFHLYHS